MSTRQIALAAVLLALVFIAHASGRILQVGGAQLAPSIGVYVFMALILAPGLGWVPLIAIALGIGVLTMLATSSPFPPANIPAHGLAFLLASYMAKMYTGGTNRELTTSQILTTVTVVLVASWTLFSTISWLGLTPQGHPIMSREFNAFNALPLGQGLVAWWIFGLLTIALPTWIIAMILTPLLYRAVRPALIRQGMIEATA
jgi:hypothetical protein